MEASYEIYQMEAFSGSFTRGIGMGVAVISRIFPGFFVGLF